MKGIKYLLLLVIVFSLCFASCFSGFFEDKAESIVVIGKEHDTKIRFVNPGAQKVTIYKDYDRHSASKIMDLAGGTSSSYMDWNDPAPEYTFYTTYYLNILSAELPYIPAPEYRGGAFEEPIKKNDTTDINIPPLSSVLYGAENEILINDAYVTIVNYTSQSFRVISGSSFLPNIRTGQTLVGSNENFAVFKISGIVLNSTRLEVGASVHPFSNLISSVDAGHCYLFTFSNNVLSYEPSTGYKKICLSNSN